VLAVLTGAAWFQSSRGAASVCIPKDNAMVICRRNGQHLEMACADWAHLVEGAAALGGARMLAVLREQMAGDPRLNYVMQFARLASGFARKHEFHNRSHAFATAMERCGAWVNAHR